MEFCKYQALGNDYLVIDPARWAVDLTPDTIRMICDRHFGVGSDGILHGPIYRDDKIMVRIYNPDGSEAEKSGNGVRIFSRYLLDEGYRTGPAFSLLTLGGEVHVSITEKDGQSIEVDMGPFSFLSSEIPVLGPEREIVDEAVLVEGVSYRMTCLSVGNPHCVIPLDTVSEKLTKSIGPKIETLSIFPKRINVQFVELLDKRSIRIEIWERGAGYTLASGSSSCAAFAAMNRLGLVERSGTVRMPGGTLEVRIDTEGRVHQRGPAVKVMEGTSCNLLV